MAPLLSKRTPVSMSTIRVSASAPTPTNTAESSTKIRYVCLKPDVVLLDVRHSPANISPEGVSPIFSRAHSSLGADGGSRFFVKEVPPLASDVLHLPLIKNLQQDQKPNSNCGTIKGGRNPEYRAGDGVCLGSLPLLPPQSSFTSPEVLDLKQKLFPRNRVTIALDHHSPGQEQNQILLQTDNRAVLTGSKTDRSPVFRRFLRRTSAHSYPQTKRKTRTGSPGPHGDRDSNPGPTKKCFLKKKADVDVSAQKVHLGQGPTGPPSGADQTRSRPGRPESNHDQSPGACPDCPKTQCLTSRGRQSPGRNARSKFGENSFFPAPPVPPFPTPLLDSSFSLKLKYSHSTRSPGCNSSSSPFSSSIAKHNVLIFVEDLVPVRPYSDDLHGKDLREEEGVGRGERYDCPGRTEEGPEGEADDSIEEKTPGRDQTSRRSRDSTPCTPPGKQTTDWSSSTRTSEGRTNRDMAVQTQGFTNQDPNWSPPTVWSYLSYLSQGAAEPLSAEKVEALRSVHPALAVFVLCEVIKNQLLLMRTIYQSNQHHHSSSVQSLSSEKVKSPTLKDTMENIRGERTKVRVEDAVRRLCQEMGLDR